MKDWLILCKVKSVRQICSNIIIAIRMCQRRHLALDALGKICIKFSISESANITLLIKIRSYYTVVLTHF